MIIRSATPGDIETLIDFQVKMAMETESVTLDSVLLRSGIGTLLSDPSKGQYYVAQQENELIGCLMTTFEWSEWRNGNFLWIQSVYVAQNHRNKGVYRTMYEHIRELTTDDVSLKGIRLYADNTNDQAKSVYRKLGMNGDHYQVFEWIKT